MKNVPGEADTVNSLCRDDVIARARDRLWTHLERYAFRREGRSYNASGLVGIIETDVDVEWAIEVMWFPDPLEPQVWLQSHNRGRSWSEDIRKRVIEDIRDHAQPEVRSDGLWWADKDTYELLRPIVAGEELDLPPSEGVVAYNPVTGEEDPRGKRVNEATLKPTSIETIDPPINEQTLDKVAVRAHAHLKRWVKEMGVEDNNNMGVGTPIAVWWGKVPGVNVSNLPTVYGWKNGKGYTCLVCDIYLNLVTEHYDIFDMRHIIIKWENSGPVVEAFSEGGGDAPIHLEDTATSFPVSAYYKAVERALNEIHEHAMPVTNGLWWADGETYDLVRPMFEGEETPPTHGLVAYDPVKGEEK